MKDTSISLGNYFDNFVSSLIATGRYKNESEVVRAALRLLEDEENKVTSLKAAIQKGLDSPRIEDFDFKDNLKRLKEGEKSGFVNDFNRDDFLKNIHQKHIVK